MKCLKPNVKHLKNDLRMKKFVFKNFTMILCSITVNILFAINPAEVAVLPTPPTVRPIALNGCTGDKCSPGDEEGITVNGLRLGFVEAENLDKANEFLLKVFLGQAGSESKNSAGNSAFSSTGAGQKRRKTTRRMKDSTKLCKMNFLPWGTFTLIPKYLTKD